MVLVQKDTDILKDSNLLFNYIEINKVCSKIQDACSGTMATVLQDVRTIFYLEAEISWTLV